VVLDWIDRREDVLVQKIWSRYLGVEDKPELAIRFFQIVRGAFYEKIDARNYSYETLQSLVANARHVINGLAERKSVREDYEYETILEGHGKAK
jgi:hypothetical protein